MPRYSYFVILLFSLSIGPVFSAPNPAFANKKPSINAKRPAVLRYDTATINERVLTPEALKNFARQEDFQYDEAYQGISLWQRFWIWFWSVFDADKRGFVATGIVYLLMGLGVGAVVFLILRLAGVDALKILRGNPVSNALPYSENPENIHELNLDNEIERAVAAQNFRFAVRILYLKCLKQLNDDGSIHWELNKTNADYSHELSDVQQRIEFNMLTRQFEYIWYGEFDVDANLYARVGGLFDDFQVKRP